MIVDSGINRFQSGWTNPSNTFGGSIALNNVVGVNSTAYQDKGYASAERGMGDITGFFSAVGRGDVSGAFTEVFTGTSPLSLIAYAGVAFLAYKILTGSKARERRGALKKARADYSSTVAGIKSKYSTF